MKRYEYYKNSGVSWLGELPSTWDCKKIGLLFSERKTKVSDKDYAPLSVAKIGIVPQLETAVKTDAGDNRKLVCISDFVINSRSDRKGSCGVSELDGSVSLINIVLKPRKNWNNRYIHYLMRSHLFSEEYYRHGRGIVADLWTTRYSEMKNIFLPVPPVSEQNQIVRFLDWQVSIVNRLIREKKTEIDNINLILKLMLKRVFSDGLYHARTFKSDLYWIDHYPTEWKSIQLKRLVSTPITDGPHITPKLLDEGIPFVSAEAAHDGRIFIENQRGFISQRDHEEFCKKLKPKRDDIFIVKSGSTTGKTVIVDIDEDFSVWSPLALVRCNEMILPRYMFYFCTSEYFQQQVKDNWSFGTQPNIGMSVLGGLKILVPDLKEQRDIVVYLDSIWNKVFHLTQTLTKQIDCLSELRTRLISDVVTGKIDVRNIEIPDFGYVGEVADIDEDTEINEKETVEDVEV